MFQPFWCFSGFFFFECDGILLFLLQHCNRSGTLVMKPETGYFTDKENYVLYKIIGSEVTEYVLTLNKVRKLNMMLQLSFINTGFCIVCMSVLF